MTSQIVSTKACLAETLLTPHPLASSFLTHMVHSLGGLSSAVSWDNEPWKRENGFTIPCAAPHLHFGSFFIIYELYIIVGFIITFFDHIYPSLPSLVPLPLPLIPFLFPTSSLSISILLLGDPVSFIRVTRL